MDDPWGSPWATNDPNPIPEPPPRASTTLELPGRILTRNRSSSSISPWAVEEDAFNDWATADAGLALPPTAAASASNWSGWGGGNGLNSSQTQLSVKDREGSLGLPSPAWPPTSSPALYPTKTLSRRSSSRSLSRQPTPDPWATETFEHRLSLPPAVHIAAEQAAFATPDSHDEAEKQGLDNIQEDEVFPATGLGVGSTDASENGYDRQPDNAAAAQQPDADLCQEPESLEEGEPEPDEEDNSGSPSASRHSSMSNESQHENRPDSPITSMDEDAKDRPQIPRRASTKVQDMVELFDGLTKRKDSSTLLVPTPDGARRPSASRSVRSVRSVGTDGASDFGDFDDAESFVPSRQPSVSESRPTSKAGRLRSGSKASLRIASANPAAAPVPSPIAEEPSKFEEVRAKFGAVQYAPDTALVDQLFDVVKLDAEQPHAKDYSLDAIDDIIKDSFTTISERKTWYRMSRPGTKRRHDMGDDDNYRRVVWAGSQVKEDATKIVRRWMEEDNYYAGRPKKGGGPMVRGGGFDWDSNNSKAEALSFDEIFGKRKSVQTPKLGAAQGQRPLSLQATAHTRSASDSVKPAPARSSMSIPAPPAGLAFGWSTGGSGASTPASVRPPSLMRQSFEVSSMKSGSSRPPSIREVEARPSLQVAPPVSKPVSNSTDPGQTLQEDEDDDDEWGEMVASPATDARPSNSFFEGSLDGSLANLSATSLVSSAAMPDTITTLNSVSSALQPILQSPLASSFTPAPATAPATATSTATAEVWDFSAFDTTPAIPPTTTSKPEFDFDTPLQSPTLSIPSRTASPTTSIHTSKPSTPRSSSPVALARAPTPPVPFRPQHAHKSSLSLVRPSPLHNVLTPDPVVPVSAEPVVPPPPPPQKSVSFVNEEPKTVSFSEDEAVDLAAVRRVVGGLPDLLYMLR